MTFLTRISLLVTIVALSLLTTVISFITINHYYNLTTANRRHLHPDIVYLKNIHSANICQRHCQKRRFGKRPYNHCNQWRYCADPNICGNRYRNCELAYIPRSGGSLWQSDEAGFISHTPESRSAVDRRYHVIITAWGPAQHWQSRICYYWYKKQKKKCELRTDRCDMGGFTRILHSGREDSLMEEIPTFVTDLLPSTYSGINPYEYIVINRPYAIFCWLTQQRIREKYVMMAEPDYIFLKPMPNLMIEDRPAVFDFFYIVPDDPKFANLTQRLLGNHSIENLNAIPHTGNAPSILSLSDLKAITRPWLELAIRIHHDPEAREAWGWVQEMYAFSIAVHLTLPQRPVIINNFIAQPPYDAELHDADGHSFYICHYTYAIGEGGDSEWRFDKRSYWSQAPTIADVTKAPSESNNAMVTLLLQSLKEAMESIQCWEHYSQNVQGPLYPDQCKNSQIAESASSADNLTASF